MAGWFMCPAGTYKVWLHSGVPGRDLQGHLDQSPLQSWANTKVRPGYLRALRSQAAQPLWVTCLIIFPVIFFFFLLTSCVSTNNHCLSVLLRMRRSRASISALLQEKFHLSDCQEKRGNSCFRDKIGKINGRSYWFLWLCRMEVGG